jgi:hypothetical protein
MVLANPGDPYVATNGKVLVPSSRDELDALPNADSVLGPPAARGHQSAKRRSIKDMPTDPRTQTAVIVVLVYSLVGLSENEIAHVVNISIDDVRAIRNHAAYQETFEMLFHELIHANSNSMVAKIAKFAPGALQNIVELAKSAENDHARLKANQDILDRAGLHHETLFGKAAGDSLDGLKIIIQQGRDDDKNDFGIEISKR